MIDGDNDVVAIERSRLKSKTSSRHSFRGIPLFDNLPRFISFSILSPPPLEKEILHTRRSVPRFEEAETTPSNDRSKIHDKSAFYYFCRWRLRGRDPREWWRFSAGNRRSRKRIRPPFASAVVKKAKSDRLSLPIIKTGRARIKATLSFREKLLEGTRGSLCFE